MRPYGGCVRAWGCVPMTLVRDPFTTTKLEEERDHADIVKVRLSPEDRERLEEVKQLLDVEEDARAFRLALMAGTVSLRQFPPAFWGAAIKKKRLYKPGRG